MTRKIGKSPLLAAGYGADKPQHTPTPWHISAAGIATRVDIYTSEKEGMVTQNCRYFDAEYIVRACNAHDELVAALDACVTELSAYYDGRNDEDADTDEALTLAAAVLAKARA